MSPAALVVAALVACNGPDPGPAGPRGSCDPLDPSRCALPYPSSFYLTPDAATATGLRVDYAPDSLPLNRDMVQVTPGYFNEKDGFSTHGPFLAYFDDLTLDGVVGHGNLDDYTAPDAKVVLIDTTTGERVPVWAEIDLSADDPAERLFMIWPAVQLEFGRTYVVGLRGLVAGSGQPVVSSEAFLALRDGIETEDYDVEFRRQHFEDVVFAALTADGIDRSTLQLAWDFTTVSRANSLGRMEHIRDEGLAIVDAGVPYTIEDLRDYDCATEPIARDFVLVAELPSYMVDPRPGFVLTRDEAGMPYQNGTFTAEYLVRIPCSVAQDPQPSLVMNYGHGMLGDYSEAKTGWLARFANDSRFVYIAHNWYGMGDEDVPAITLALVNDPSQFAVVPERSHQGYFAAMAGLRILTRQLADDDATKFPDADGALVSVVDPDNVGYYGISQGGIMGGALIAMSPDLHHGVLGVPGAPYSLLLWRSRNFEPFFRIFKEKFDDHRDISLMIAMFEMLWEPTEAGGWLTELRGAEGKRVLLQPAIGDPQVTTLGAHVMVRTIGGKSITPSPRPIWGVEDAAAPYEGHAIVEYAYSDAPAELSEPVTNVPQQDVPDPHECPRRDPAGQEQVREFLRTGVVTQPCDGPCGSSVAETCPE